MEDQPEDKLAVRIKEALEVYSLESGHAKVDVEVNWAESQTIERKNPYFHVKSVIIIKHEEFTV